MELHKHRMWNWTKRLAFRAGVPGRHPSIHSTAPPFLIPLYVQVYGQPLIIEMALTSNHRWDQTKCNMGTRSDRDLFY